MAFQTQPLVYEAFADNNAKVKQASIRVAVAVDYDTAEAAITAAWEGLANGTPKEKGTTDREVNPVRVIGIKASDSNHKWRISYRDTVTGNVESHTIPTANYLLRATDSDALDTTLDAYTDIVAAVNTYYRSSRGNAVVFVSCMYEG